MLDRATLLERTVHVMQQNRQRTDGHTYTVPSTSSYPYQWFWDSCFHAIIYTHFDSAAAKDELRSLVAHQHSDGFIPHIACWQKHPTLSVNLCLDDTSGLIQPPLIAYATWRAYEPDTDEAFLAELYEPLAKYYQYLLRERDVREIGLIGIVDPDESGEDNSPRYDHLLGLPPHHSAEENFQKRMQLAEIHATCELKASCTSKTFWAEDVSMNSFLVQGLFIMSDIATILNKPKEAHQFKDKATKTKTAMRTHMFTDGRFWSLQGLAGDKITSKTLDLFMPLFAGLYSQQEAAALIQNILFDEGSYWLPHGVPTTAKDDPAFDPTEPNWGEHWQHPTWRGPIWMSMQWFLYYGLKKYGFHEKAAELKQKSLRLIEQSGFREYYNPLTGEGMGSIGFTWGGLTLDMTGGE